MCLKPPATLLAASAADPAWVAVVPKSPESVSMAALSTFCTVWPISLRIEPNSVSTPLLDRDRKSTRLNSSHQIISYAVFCLKKKKNTKHTVYTHLTKSYIRAYH